MAPTTGASTEPTPQANPIISLETVAALTGGDALPEGHVHRQRRLQQESADHQKRRPAESRTGRATAETERR